MAEVLPIDLIIHLTRLKLYEAIAIGGMDRVTPEYVAGLIGHGVTSSFVKMAMRQLKELSEVELEGDARPSINILQTKFSAELTPYGARIIEKDLRDPNSIMSLYRDKGIEVVADNIVNVEPVPASDRIVSKNDNQAAYDQSLNSLDELVIQLKTSNEAGSLLGDDRELAIEEVSLLKSMIGRARVRSAPVLAFARRSLGWIAEKSGSAAIGDIARRALSSLIEWLFS